MITVLAQSGSSAALFTFLVYTAAVFVLAGVANRLLRGRDFLNEYFLGSRGLGVWAFALTFAATSASGGSFTGFPSKIYTHGWVLALWIGSYMVVPIFTIGLLGKRINQVARRSGAITVPDIIRARFGSRTFGLLATLLIVFFTSFNLVAQFKAGREILRTLLQDVGPFQSSAAWLGNQVSGIGFFAGVEPEYLLCLLAFGIAVIVYTTYGGFHAVVWTDVMQGIVMVAGVVILLPLALSAAGGLENATQDMAKMIPPDRGVATVNAAADDIERGGWLSMPGDDGSPRVFRVARVLTAQEAAEAGSFSESDLPAGGTFVDCLEIKSPHEVARIVDGSAGISISTTATVTAFASTLNPETTFGMNEPGAYVSGPGPSYSSSSGFLPFSLAISFFFMWCMAGAGQPNFMVRLMAFRDAQTLRKGIMTVTIYYSLIYFPLVIIFCCARVVLPGMEIESDRIMPAMALYLTERAGAAWLAGLLIAAPFAAVMSTVDSFLLVISSAVVRDLYQGNINPDASEKTMKRLSYGCTLVVGLIAMFGAVNPPEFLQDIIVYVGSGLAACFLAPMVYGLYWPRINTSGAVAAMLGGFGAHLSMYLLGLVTNGSFFNPFKILGFDPTAIGLVSSFVCGYVVTRLTAPPPEELVQKYFCKPAAS